MAGTISKDFLGRVADVRLPDADAIDAFFRRDGASSFIGWFNANVAGKGAWEGKRIPATPACADRFALFWSDTASLFKGPPNLVQFVALMSIFVNEVGGDLLPIQEKVGREGHPGLAYAFDAIPGLKQSYNTLAGNKTAFDLFHDPLYRGAHGQLPLAGRFAQLDAISPAWRGTVWPEGVPTSTDPAVNGFVQAADFFKFRGRGLIQTTGRANYKKLIPFIQGYAGSDPVLRSFAARWAGKCADDVATISTNADWSTLFLDTRLELARHAIRMHEQCAGGYFSLAVEDATTLNGEGAGSIFRMGKRISGGDAYARTFARRVGQICAML